MENQLLSPEKFWNSQSPMKNIPDAIHEYHELKLSEMNTIKKSGMYGEMPKIQIGKYSISEMSNNENENTVWIQDTETNEGGQFQKSDLSKILDQFFCKYF